MPEILLIFGGIFFIVQGISNFKDGAIGIMSLIHVLGLLFWVCCFGGGLVWG